MDPITQQTALASAGGKKDQVYVDDVFSTYLYKGNGSTQTITNGIDLAGEGGLVWLKNRTSAVYGGLWDTERGVTKRLRTDTTGSEGTASNLVTSFNSDGVSISATGGTQINGNNEDYVSWTFRKAPGFFDIVTYAGTGSNRTVAHNLGSVPGMIIVKCLTTGRNWPVWHRSISSNVDNKLQLNTTSAVATGTNVWGGTAPTATEFTVNDYSATNQSGQNFVAYIFAHDDAQFGTDEDESIIKCGSYTGNGSSIDINLGFEPQWLLIKCSSNGTTDWLITDTMRGSWNPGTGNDNMTYLRPNNDQAEGNTRGAEPTSTGFKVRGAFGNSNASGRTYIYMAIRRPNKPPTAATEVFNTVQNNTTLISGTKVDFGFTPDMHIASRVTSSSSRMISSRLMGGRYSFTDNTSAEGAALSSYNKEQTTVEYTGQASNDSGTYLHYGFKRTPGFFDVITYTGASSYPITRYHSLGVAPEMIWLKLLDHTTNPWTVYHSLYGSNSRLRINEISAVHTDNQLSDWYLTTPTDSYFKVGTHGGYTNLNGKLHIAYLWATLPGISKVGSYTGTGNDINVDCGFTSGARFVLIKLASGEGNWYVYDSVRGIGSGNDPFLKLNSSAAQTSNSDYIDIDASSTGFKINSGSSFLNISGGTYIFLAIA